MTADFIVPKDVVDALAALDISGGPMDEYMVQGTLAGVANGLGELSEAELPGLAAEVLAFNFVGQNERTSLWGTHFGPMMTGEDRKGNFVCSPDIAQVDPVILQYWSNRATAVGHPVLKARYADLAWDFAPVLGEKRNVDTVKIAIDAYVAGSGPQYRDGLHARLRSAVRAFDLAMQIKDAARSDAARATLMALHADAIMKNEPVWWIAPSRLLRDSRTGLTGQQRAALIKSLEDLAAVFGDINNSARFDPNDLERTVEYLEKHYRRHGTDADIKRLHEVVARAFEAAAGLGDVMVAPSFLQSAINAYRHAGMREDAARGRILMEEAIQSSNKTMKSVGTSIEIKREEIDKLIAAVVVNDSASSLALIANSFVASKASLEAQMQEIAKVAPLQAMMPKKLMQDDHVAATIGSITGDPAGRLIDQATLHLSIEAPWLMYAFDGVLDEHDLTADHFAGWTNRLGLFDDTTFLKEGFAAWLDEDYVKALHVLVPQAERGLRAIAASVGLPITKPHPVTKDASVSINMGDILSNEKVLAVIGEDIALHFRALYADPRGMNLRNRVAHGLYSPRSLGPHIVRLVVHSLLVLGVWQDIENARENQRRGRPL
jgi:lysyl-tRNA synthetase class 1